MNAELENKLFEKYPKMFANAKLSPAQSPMSFGIETGDGWFNLISTACYEIASHMERKNLEFAWDQIKEKFGTLRLYYTGGDDYISGVIAMTESLSASTCETCGGPGKCGGKGWITTLCDSCRKTRDEPKS